MEQRHFLCYAAADFKGEKPFENMDASRHLKRFLGKKTILEQILKKTLSGNISMDSKDMNYNHKIKYKTKYFGNL